MSNERLTSALDRLASGRDLEAGETAEVLREIMEGRATEVQTAAFLIALRTKGESVSELVGLARTMRELCVEVHTGRDDLLDTAGTGGGKPTFNVSTTAALVAASAGCAVAKHGNRSATGKCGSADVLQALGAQLELSAEAVAECINSVGFGFMFAPLHHQAMKHVVGVRKTLAVRTVFNFLGPLTNPAGATCQVIGVSDPTKLELIAGSLRELGGRRALVVSSEDGLDEISVSAPTSVVELADGLLRSYTLQPSDVGITPAAPTGETAGDPAQNAATVRRVLSGEPGWVRSVAALNAGAAIYVAGEAASIAEGVRCAERAIDSEKAGEQLDRYIEASRRLSADST